MSEMMMMSLLKVQFDLRHCRHRLHRRDLMRTLMKRLQPLASAHPAAIGGAALVVVGSLLLRASQQSFDRLLGQLADHHEIGSTAVAAQCYRPPDPGEQTCEHSLLVHLKPRRLQQVSQWQQASGARSPRDQASAQGSAKQGKEPHRIRVVYRQASAHGSSERRHVCQTPLIEGRNTPRHDERLR